MMILIVGRTSSGKDYFAERLTEKGLSIVKSYTTRARRTPDEDTHIFVTEEEAAKITNKAATTIIKGHEYFGTTDQVENSDIYIIDPRGLYQITENMPDESFLVVYVSADPEIRRQRAIARAMPSEELTDEEKAEKEKDIGEDFDMRNADEDEQFSKFETQIEIFKTAEDPWGESNIPQNVVGILYYKNDFTMPTLVENANAVLDYQNRYDNIKALVEEAIELNLLTLHEGYISVMAKGHDTDDALGTHVSKDTFISYLTGSKASLGDLLFKVWNARAVRDGKFL